MKKYPVKSTHKSSSSLSTSSSSSRLSSASLASSASSASLVIISILGFMFAMRTHCHHHRIIVCALFAARNLLYLNFFLLCLFSLSGMVCQVIFDTHLSIEVLGNWKVIIIFDSILSVVCRPWCEHLTVSLLWHVYYVVRLLSPLPTHFPHQRSLGMRCELMNRHTLSSRWCVRANTEPNNRKNGGHLIPATMCSVVPETICRAKEESGRVRCGLCSIRSSFFGSDAFVSAQTR